jgi:hypothetical protein
MINIRVKYLTSKGSNEVNFEIDGSFSEEQIGHIVKARLKRITFTSREFVVIFPDGRKVIYESD